MIRISTLFSAGLLAASLLVPTAANASRYLQCVPFARDLSGIEIYGNAKTWWHQAEGVYERGHLPREGAVLNLPGSGRMRLGHVAVVSKIVNDREILLNHANWSRRGGLERDVRAVDVSEKGDWSRVKVWFAGTADLGTTTYPAFGFIYAGAIAPQPKQDRGPLLSSDVLHMAALEAAPSSL